VSNTSCAMLFERSFSLRQITSDLYVLRKTKQPDMEGRVCNNIVIFVHLIKPAVLTPSLFLIIFPSNTNYFNVWYCYAASFLQQLTRLSWQKNCSDIGVCVCISKEETYVVSAKIIFCQSRFVSPVDSHIHHAT
jgi:hypothetical protein